MLTLDEKFKELAAENAPGQEVRQNKEEFKSQLKGENLGGLPVDFSHGDIDAFEPIPGSEIIWEKGFKKGGVQAYKEYRGDLEIRENLAKELSGIVGFMEQLLEVDVEGVDALTSVSPMALSRRIDAVTDGDQINKILKNAPDSREGFFAVPKVME